MRRYRNVLAGLASLLLATAQSIPRDEIRSTTVPYVRSSTATLRAEVRVVEVPVVVRDAQSRAVAGLTHGDFEMFDNGKKQPITVFSTQSFSQPTEAQPGASFGIEPRPRFLALCLDDLHLLPALLGPVKEAAERFVRTSLAPGDRVVVVRTSKSENYQFTSDVPKLLEEIAKVTSSLMVAADDQERCPHIAVHEAYKIANRLDPGDQLLHAKIQECLACYGKPCWEGEVTGRSKVIWTRARSFTVDSLTVIESLVDGMAKLPGQRLILLTSGGFISGTLEADLMRLVDKARHAEVVINSIDARGLQMNTSGGMAFDGMGILASGTGGTLFQNNNDMERGFRNLGMVPQTSYLLGFTPTGKADGSFHKLKVQLAARKGLTLEARLGYTASTTEAPPESPLDHAVMATGTVTDLPVTFTWEQWPGTPGITMVAHLDISKLQFKPSQDRRTQRLNIVAVVVDAHGNFIAGKRSDLQLSFRQVTYAQLAKTGFTAAVTVNAPPGSYSVRAVAKDAIEGKLSAASETVDIK